MLHRCFIVLLAAAALTGCATQTKTPAQSKRMQALERKLKAQQMQIEDLKEKNFVLESRKSLKQQAAEEIKTDEAIVTSEPPANLPESFKPPQKATVSKNLPTMLPSKKADTAPPPIAVTPDKTGEHYLYSKVLETYRDRNAEELQRTVELLLKSYPESVFNDRAIYLEGLLAFEQQDFKTAQAKFDKILREYPRSNKAVAAIFAKASIDKRLGHAASARKGFLQVKDLYPGSPEAARVSVELKLLEKHRES